jgi:hypothetical protein
MSEEEATVEVKRLDFKNYLNAYEFETTLPGSKEVIKFKPITTGQLKRLLVYENETDPMMIEKALDELISSCIITENFDINKLYLQDRFFLLVEIRRKSKGDNYQFQFQCGDCRSQSIQNIDLSELEVIGIPEDINSIVKMDDNLSVKLVHITRGGQKIAYKNIKNRKKLTDTQRITEMALFTHAVSIVSIITPEGEIMDASIDDKKYLLENVPTDAYGKVRDWFENNTFGMDFTYTIKCNGCDYNEKIDIPVENFFF